MAIIKWEPFDEVERFFEDFPIPKPFKDLGSDLAIDMYEEGENIVAKMNVPGVDPNKININVDNNTLRVSGVHEEEKEKKNKHYYRKEIKKGSFERVVSLPQAIQKDNIEAEYMDGILTITLPKLNKEEQFKKIEIKVKK